MNDIEINAIKSCQKGDLKQFGLLYDRYIKKIYDFVFYKTHHKEIAEDLVSQSFMKALNNISKFNINEGTFQAWIYQIARNTVIDHYRTKKQDINIEDVWDLARDEDLERDIDAKNKLKRIEKYIKELKPQQRDIIIMRVWQGMSYEEIAEVMKQSEASCKMTYSRAIRKLRKEMPLGVFLGMIVFGF